MRNERGRAKLSFPAPQIRSGLCTGEALLTSSSAVRVSGGLGSLALSMRAMAAVQLPWQSNRALMIPPLMMPGNAWYLLASCTVAERPFCTRKLSRCRPSSAAGPATTNTAQQSKELLHWLLHLPNVNVTGQHWSKKACMYHIQSSGCLECRPPALIAPLPQQACLLQTLGATCAIRSP